MVLLLSVFYQYIIGYKRITNNNHMVTIPMITRYLIVNINYNLIKNVENTIIIVWKDSRICTVQSDLSITPVLSSIFSLIYNKVNIPDQVYEISG